jgi:short-subunit dehydrogenase
MTNQTAIITGASSGIGKELAIQLASRHWNVFMIARRKEHLENISDTINASDAGSAAWYACDVSNEQEIKKAIKKAIEVFHDIDLLIVNAGIRKQLPSMDIDMQTVRKVYEANVFGALHTVKSALPYFLQKQKGEIIAISSVSSFCSLPRGHPYCASKSALNRHMRGLYYELKPKNIKVTTVFLGFVRTPMIENQRFKVPQIIEASVAANRIIKVIGSNKKTHFVHSLPFLFFIRFMNALPEYYHYFLFRKTGLA